MITFLVDLNTKSAVLYLIVLMTMFNLSCTFFIVWAVSISNRLRVERKIHEAREAILKRISAILSHIGEG